MINYCLFHHSALFIDFLAPYHHDVECGWQIVEVSVIEGASCRRGQICASVRVARAVNAATASLLELLVTTMSAHVMPI